MSGTAGWDVGDVSGATVLTANDHLYEDHINEQRESNPFAVVVGLTSNCQYSCDGTADDVQIQAAIDAVLANGRGTVYIKKGSYNLNSTITIPSGSRYLTIKGDNGPTLLKNANGLDKLISLEGSGAGGLNVSYCRFEDLWLRGDNTTACSLIKATFASLNTFKNIVTDQNTATDSIGIELAGGHVFSNRFYDLFLRGNYYGLVNKGGYNLFFGSGFNQNESTGALINFETVFFGSTFEANKVMGINFDDGSILAIAGALYGCYFEAAAGIDAIHIGETAGFKILILDGCKFDGARDNDIVADTVNTLVIRSCYFKGTPAAYNVVLKSGVDLVVAEANEGMNIYEDGFAGELHRIHERGRKITNSGTGSIASGATSATITHGLAVTPTVDDISITLAENPTNTPGAIWVDTIGATTFKVNCENDPGASNLDFGWRAQVL